MIEGLGFRVQGVRLGAEVFGFWVLGFGFWALGFGFWVLGFGFWVLGFGFWVWGFNFHFFGFRERPNAADPEQFLRVVVSDHHLDEPDLRCALGLLGR